MKDQATHIRLIRAKVNCNAFNTWLEPYAGWSFDIKKRVRKVVWFYMDKGHGEHVVEKHSINLFDFEQ